MMKLHNRSLLRVRFGFDEFKKSRLKNQRRLVDVLFDDSRPKNYTTSRRLLSRLKFRLMI
jgi:hypothetical protein